MNDKVRARIEPLKARYIKALQTENDIPLHSSRFYWYLQALVDCDIITVEEFDKIIGE